MIQLNERDKGFDFKLEVAVSVSDVPISVGKLAKDFLCSSKRIAHAARLLAAEEWPIESTGGGVDRKLMLRRPLSPIQKSTLLHYLRSVYPEKP